MIQNKLKNIDLSKPGAIDEIDTILHSIKNMPKLSLHQIYALSPKREDIGSILVGLCALFFLKSPEFNSIEWNKYKKMEFSFEEKQLIVSGLINVIRYIHIEMSDEIDAIDFIYAACIALYRICPEKAEEILTEELKFNPTPSLIEALGVLVGHEVKGYITKETFLLLKLIAEKTHGDLRNIAKKVLKEDVERMNLINHFL